ncbi:LysR family transcriptional regulator [Tenggerimyces flavus]|uniref:LysR family transcriptional regulator n=1 Tax=Tenggerimyces flavus TaxID=1708749 RepID=A0ABV7YF04_9ACTN|nr:LysR family transcriptional regulator [Tenggerimyces flavus]MBM7787140.1 DNA-binding transcriptional LysR family regulator [Tenggerimyces flavus]
MFPVESLSAFRVFADHLNFTRAAEELHISQPALHVKVRKLAEAVGRPLYLRTGNHLVLTADGERLARFARDRERQLTEFLGELTGTHAAEPLVLAAGQGAYLYLLGDVIAAERQDLRLVTASRPETLARVRDGRAHVGVAVLDAVPTDLECVLLAAYPQTLVVRADHRLARRRRLRVRDLDGLELIVPPAPRPLRVLLERWLHGVDWRVAVEAEGWPLLLHFVGLGVGAAVVNGCVRTKHVQLPIVDLPDVPYYAIHRRPDDPRVARLVGAMVAAVPQTT